MVATVVETVVETVVATVVASGHLPALARETPN